MEFTCGSVDGGEAFRYFRMVFLKDEEEEEEEEEDWLVPIVEGGHAMPRHTLKTLPLRISS